MALQCYKRALETDSCCVCALYRSMLIYRQLGNTQAEIQALRLLHSVSDAHTLYIYSPYMQTRERMLVIPACTYIFKLEASQMKRKKFINIFS